MRNSSEVRTIYFIYVGAVMQGVSMTATLIHLDGYSLSAILPSLLASALCGPLAWKFFKIA
jgi:hypothetical protein